MRADATCVSIAAGDASQTTGKVMRLRYAGTCRECGSELAAGTSAVYDRSAESSTVPE